MLGVLPAPGAGCLCTTRAPGAMSSFRRHPHGPWVEPSDPAARDRNLSELERDLQRRSVPDEDFAGIGTVGGDLDGDLENAQPLEDDLASLLQDTHLLHAVKGGRGHAHALTAIAVGLAVALALLLHSLVQSPPSVSGQAEVATAHAPFANVNAAGAVSPTAHSRHAGRAHAKHHRRRPAVKPLAALAAGTPSDSQAVALQGPAGAPRGSGSMAEFRFER